MFAPHKANITPFCVSCESDAQVSTHHSDITWNDKFIQVFTCDSWYELFSPRYKCLRCTVTFRSHDARSLKLGGARMIGMLRYHLSDSRCYALDKSLYNFINSRVYDPPALIHRQLQHSYMSRYASDLISYFVLALSGNVKKTAAGNVLPNDRRQRTLQFPSHATNNQSNVNEERRKRRKAYRQAERDLEVKQNRASDNIDIQALIDEKNDPSKGVTVTKIGHLGPGKLGQLLECGYTTLFQFAFEWRSFYDPSINYDRVNLDREKDCTERIKNMYRHRGLNGNPQRRLQDKLESWVQAIEKEFDERGDAAEIMQVEFENKWGEYNIEEDTSPTNNNNGNLLGPAQQQIDQPELIIPEFPDCVDEGGYNIKFITARRIYNIQHTYHCEQSEQSESHVADA